jgi:hypothetical protein
MIKSCFCCIPKKITLLFFVCFFTISCSVQIDTTHRHISGSRLLASENNSAAYVIATENNKALQEYRDNEWQYNRTDKNSAPKTCLALSGGGIRSASFSIGVLKGLHEKGILKQIDVISAVSGGSYALSWYYIQQYKYGSEFTVTEEMLRQLEKHGADPQDINILKSAAVDKYQTLGAFMQQIETLLQREPEEKYRKIIVAFSRLSKGDAPVFSDEYLTGLAEKSRMYGFGDMAGTFLGNIVMLPVNILVNGIFSGNVNFTSQRAYYEHAIKRTFHSSIDEEFVTLDKFNMISITFKQINDFIKTNHLPYFIINTSADIDDDRNHYKSKLKNTVFEFTPIRIGSDGFGYANSDQYNIGLAVSVSGAAVDSTEVPGKFNSLLSSAFNMDLGYYIKNYHDGSQDNSFARKMTPFPFYYLWMEDPHRRDQMGMDIYLTDGGHAENLAAYSLVRRACEHIIIVDAEYDDKYEFEAYHHLKKALLSEMQMQLDVPGLLENKWGWLNNRKLDAVETGSIKNLISLNMSGGIDYKDLKVTYIKLAINDTLINHNETKARKFYGGKLVDYYKKSKNNRCDQWLMKCEFPQYTTTDQSYSAEQFKAYIDLGYSIVRNSAKIPALNTDHAEVVNN